jgi:hypothetical protein
MADKIYVGGGWEHKFGVDVEIDLDKLKELKVDKWGRVHLKVNRRKEEDPKSKQTHWVAENDFYWNKQEEKGATASTKNDSSSLPF